MAAGSAVSRTHGSPPQAGEASTQAPKLHWAFELQIRVRSLLQRLFGWQVPTQSGPAVHDSESRRAQTQVQDSSREPSPRSQ